MTADSIDAASVPITWNLWRRGHYMFQNNESTLTTLPPLLNRCPPTDPESLVQSHSHTQHSLCSPSTRPHLPAPPRIHPHVCLFAPLSVLTRHPPRLVPEHPLSPPHPMISCVRYAGRPSPHRPYASVDDERDEARLRVDVLVVINLCRREGVWGEGWGCGVRCEGEHAPPCNQAAL